MVMFTSKDKTWSIFRVAWPSMQAGELTMAIQSPHLKVRVSKYSPQDASLLPQI